MDARQASLRATLGLLVAGCTPATFGWRDATPPAEPGLVRYKAAFDREVGERVARTADTDELVAATRDARVLFLGDHHRDAGLHARWLGLIARLAADPRPLVLGVECVGRQDQATVDAFLGGALPMRGLRHRLAERWPDHWLDSAEVDAAFYRGLLGFARDAGLPVVALEPTPRLPLARRDPTIAAAIRAAAAAHPRALIVVVVGQAHLLGIGDLLGRVRLPAVVVVGAPPAPLRAVIEAAAPATDFVVTERGAWIPVR